MTQFEWSIKETEIIDNVLKSVKYYCKASEADFSVETEGYWKMRTQHEIPEDLSEQLVAHWVDLDAIQDGKHLIKSRLQEQLDALKSATSTKPPWAVETFKVTI
jgi:uncharacterized coiled-coil protein SlyX